MPWSIRNECQHNFARKCLTLLRKRTLQIFAGGKCWATSRRNCVSCNLVHRPTIVKCENVVLCESRSIKNENMHAFVDSKYSSTLTFTLNLTRDRGALLKATETKPNPIGRRIEFGFSAKTNNLEVESHWLKKACELSSHQIS